MIAPASISEVLPPLYSAWIAELLRGPIPGESRATCDDCAMCARGEEQQSSHADYFDPAVKCCSYFPVLHNFLAGRILSDDDWAAEPGRTTVEKRIKAGLAVTPLGLGQPPVFSLLSDNSTNSFGRSHTLRCPHYVEDGGRCGVWRHRESTCATWFCKHDRGAVGFAFWRDALHQLLKLVERELARWAVMELGFEADALRHLVDTAAWQWEPESVTGEAIDNRVDPDSYAPVWGRWLGREAEFFIECARLVNPLSWNDVLAITGTEVRAYARLTKEAYSRLISDEIPPALKVGEMHLIQIKRDMTRVGTYSSYDPIDIPNVVMESLHHFDGRPIKDAIAAIADEKGVRLDPSLVRKMVDFKVLVAPEPQTESDVLPRN